jgi:diguanylate cyclase (GGDEF)-like protein
MAKKILILHTDAAFRELILPVLKQNGNTVVCADASGAHPELKAEDADIVIASASMLAARMQGIIADMPPEESPAEKDDAGNGNDLAGVDASQMKGENAVRFEELKASFVRTLPDVMKTLSDAVVKAKGGDERAREEVRAISHRMGGTAGSFKFNKLAAPLQRIELAVVKMPKLKPPDQERAWVELEQHLQKAVSSAEALAANISSLPGASGENKLLPNNPTMATMLVVDTDETYMGHIGEIAKSKFIEVVRASQPADAFELASSNPIDAALIAIDPESPDAAFKLARDLRNLPGCDAMPLGFIASDRYDFSMRGEATHAGASIFIDRELPRAKLEMKLQALMGLKQGGKPRVLIIDDDPHFVEAVSLLLRSQGFVPRGLTEPDRTLDIMHEFPPELVLLDLNMPFVNGYEICQAIRSLRRWQDLPIIFLTSETGAHARLNSFRAGADDYLPKPIVAEELIARVRVRLERSRLMRERSDKDNLSGLLNRRAFVEQLTGMLAEAERSKSPVTVCLLDIDKFKLVNDHHGHLSGDAVIAGLGQLLSKRFRAEDIRGRWGGEEFIMAFRHVGKEVMSVAVTRALEEFKKLVFQGEEDDSFSASFSAGLATYPDDGNTFLELMAIADKRLYAAKNGGRSLIVCS